MATVDFEAKAAALGRAIKFARENRALTQAELGEKVELSRAAIAAFETGRVTPSLEILHNIGDALQVSARDLINRYLDSEYDKVRRQPGDKLLARVMAKIQSLARPQLENTSKLLDLVILRDGLPRAERSARETAKRKDRI